MVVTDSFHGLCFSIIFNKKVNCLINTNRGADRFKSLQKILHIPQEVFFYDSDTYDIKQNINIMLNYNEINDLIAKARDIGLNELNKIVNIEKVKNQENEKTDKILLKKYYKKKFKLSYFIKKNIYLMLFNLLHKEKFREKYLKYKNK